MGSKLSVLKKFGSRFNLDSHKMIGLQLYAVKV